MRPWSGTIAWTNRPSGDGRVIGGLVVEQPVEIALVERTGRAGDWLALVGRVQDVHVMGNGAVMASGITDKAPGRYPVAIELSDLMSVSDRVEAEKCGEVAITGRLRAVMLLEDGQAVWPDVAINVE